MKIELRRQMNIDACKSIMEIGKFQPEYASVLPVLMLAEEGDLTPSAVNSKLFSTAPDDPRGRYLLERLAEYRLVEKSTPTSMGEPSNAIGSNGPLSTMSFILSGSGTLMVEYLKKSRITATSRTLKREIIDKMIQTGLISQGFEIFVYEPTSKGVEIREWVWPKTPESDNELWLMHELLEGGFVEGDTTQTDEVIQGEFNLTDLGEQILPTLGKYFFSYSDMDGEKRTIFDTLANSGILLSEPDINPRGIFSTNESHMISRWAWPRIPETEDESEMFRKFLHLGLVHVNNASIAKQSVHNNVECEASEAVYILTETGRIALAEGWVPIPEKGVYIIHGTSDPVLSNPVISCQPETANQAIETERPYNRKNRHSPASKKPPRVDYSWLATLKERIASGPLVLNIPHNSNDPLQIISIDPSVEPSNTTVNATLFLTLEYQKDPIVRISTAGTSKKNGTTSEWISVEHKFNLDFEEVVRSIFSNRIDDIYKDDDGFTLLVPFNDAKTKLAILTNRRMDYRVDAPEIESYGPFEGLTIQNLRVAPRTLRDARAWAEWCFHDKIQYHITGENYERLRQECAGMWEPRFSEEEIIDAIPAYENAIRICERGEMEDRTLFWYLMTPYLLTMKEVS